MFGQHTSDARPRSRARVNESAPGGCSGGCPCSSGLLLSDYGASTRVVEAVLFPSLDSTMALLGSAVTVIACPWSTVAARRSMVKTRAPPAAIVSATVAVQVTVVTLTVQEYP